MEMFTLNPEIWKVQVKLQELEEWPIQFTFMTQVVIYWRYAIILANKLPWQDLIIRPLPLF